MSTIHQVPGGWAGDTYITGGEGEEDGPFYPGVDLSVVPAAPVQTIRPEIVPVEGPGPVGADFESYYDKELSISTLGVDGYLRKIIEVLGIDEAIYLVSIVGDEGEEFVGRPMDFDWESIQDRQKWSHNFAFDGRVYYYLRLHHPELPDLLNSPWNCTANLATYFRGGRSLKKAAKNLLGWEITKDVRDKMKGVRAKDMPHMPSDDPEYANFYEQVCGYALHDSRACRELAVQYAPYWPEMERRLSDLTTRGCHTGLPLNVEKLERGKILLQNKIWEVEQNLPWVSEGYAATSPKGLAEACRKAGIPHPPSTAEDDSRCILWEETYGPQYPWVADMRVRRKANILLKRAITLLDGAHEGWFSYSLKYGGAHTMRWSGGYGA